MDKRLRPGAEKGKDMLASHLQSGLTRNELLAEAFLKMYVPCTLSHSHSAAVIYFMALTWFLISLNTVLPVQIPQL